MKNIILATLVAFAVFGCGSDKLDNSKAEKIINSCLEKNPIERMASLYILKAKLEGKKLEDYKKLEEEGYIKLAPAKPNYKKISDSDPLADFKRQAQKRRYARDYKNAYDVELTEKGLAYTKDTRKNTAVLRMKSHHYEVDEILEIRETPAYNVASVKVKLKPVGTTPFTVLYGEPAKKERIETYKFTKTNDGWKYCD